MYTQSKHSSLSCHLGTAWLRLFWHSGRTAQSVPYPAWLRRRIHRPADRLWADHLGSGRAARRRNRPALRAASGADRGMYAHYAWDGLVASGRSFTRADVARRCVAHCEQHAVSDADQFAGGAQSRLCRAERGDGADGLPRQRNSRLIAESVCRLVWRLARPDRAISLRTLADALGVYGLHLSVGRRLPGTLAGRN